MQVLWGIGGMVVLLAIAFLLSTNRRAVNLRTVAGALIIQIVFAFIVLYWELGRQALQVLTNGVQAVIDTSNEGIQFPSSAPSCPMRTLARFSPSRCCRSSSSSPP